VTGQGLDRDMGWDRDREMDRDSNTDRNKNSNMDIGATDIYADGSDTLRKFFSERYGTLQKFFKGYDTPWKLVKRSMIPHKNLFRGA
jgi:hypothetical protein